MTNNQNLKLISVPALHPSTQAKTIAELYLLLKQCGLLTDKDRNVVEAQLVDFFQASLAVCFDGQSIREYVRHMLVG